MGREGLAEEVGKCKMGQIERRDGAARRSIHVWKGSVCTLEKMWVTESSMLWKQIKEGR